jgi:hypothetical protein
VVQGDPHRPRWPGCSTLGVGVGSAGQGPRSVRAVVEAPVAVCALWWRWQSHPAGRRVEGPRYWEVRYEDLVARPRETAEGLCAFLEYGSHPKCSLTTSADSGGNPACPRRRPGLHQACVIGGPRCRRGTSRCSRPWRGDLLSSLGYERAADSASPAVRALAQTLSELVGRGVGAAPGHNRTANRPQGITSRGLLH